MNTGKRPPLARLKTAYREVHAPPGLTHNTRRAARGQMRRRWPIVPMATAAALIVTAFVALRPGAPPVPAPGRSAQLPSLAAIGHRLSTIERPALPAGTIRPPSALPPLPTLPPIPGPQPPQRPSPDNDDARNRPPSSDAVAHAASAVPRPSPAV